MSKPARKPNIAGMLLPYIIIFLALQLWMMRGQQAPDARTSTVLVAAMRDLNAKARDLDMAGLRPTVDRRIDEEFKGGKLTQGDADDRRFEVALLTSDCQLREGQVYHDLSRMQAAYQGLEREYKARRGTPIWQAKTFPMPGQHVAWTGQALFDHARETLSQANQRDLTYGILPGYDIIDFLVRMSGSRPGLSYWLACLILAVLVRAAVYPLSQKQYMWGRQMGQLQPLTREIKEKYKDDVQTQGLKTMELYREYGMNPYAGCLPALIQLPLFLTVYQFMLRYRFEFQKGTFLWINPSIDISNGWFAPNLGMEDKLLVIFYAITMVVSTLLMPITDPSNARQQRLISVGISVVFAASMLFGAFPVPAAFILYWTFTNILATAQAIRAYRSPLPPLVKVNSPTGGVYPAPSVKTGGWREKIMKAMEQQMEDQKRRQEDTGATKPELPTNGKVRTGKPATHKPKKRR